MRNIRELKFGWSWDGGVGRRGLAMEERVLLSIV